MLEPRDQTNSFIHDQHMCNPNTCPFCADIISAYKRLVMRKKILKPVMKMYERMGIVDKLTKDQEEGLRKAGL